MPNDDGTNRKSHAGTPPRFGDANVPIADPDADTLELPIIRPLPSAQRPQGTRGDTHVEVRFEGDAWRITGAGIDGELVFNELADAERRAIELSRDLHVGVIVYGDRESVVARYAPQPEATR